MAELTPQAIASHAITLHAGPYGPLRILAKPNPDTGVLRCRVEATKAVGVFTLEPAFDADDVDLTTTRLYVHYGDELPSGAHTGQYRPNRPVINRTVHLVDYSLIDAHTAQEGGRTPNDLGMRIWRRDAGSGHRRAAVPDRTARHVAAIVAQLAIYWLQRPDLDHLRRAAARHLLHRIGLQHKRDRIAELEAMIADKQRELAKHRTQLAWMSDLVTEHAASTPGPAVRRIPRAVA
ncbi:MULTISPECIES: hypothetical protein [unclassified Nonomuraea]|uniref:hypothetical protein n=1 Tax=unclassified Nonomuraea TaxID=2593643 RepID=UPI0033CF04BC